MSFYAENLLKISQNEQNAMFLWFVCFGIFTYPDLSADPRSTRHFCGLQEFQYGKNFKKEAFPPKKTWFITVDIWIKINQC